MLNHLISTSGYTQADIHPPVFALLSRQLLSPAIDRDPAAAAPSREA
jgi:hypothetical protein